MLTVLGSRLSRALARVAATTGVLLLLVVAVVPLTGRLGGAAVGGLLVLGLVIGLLTLSERDGCAILTWMIVLLLLVPQPFVLVGPLRSVGNPAMLVALVGLGIWAASRVLNFTDAVELHPVRWVLLAFTVAALASYAAGLLRDLTSAEQAGMNRFAFQFLAQLGIVLLAVDALGSRDRITALLQRLVLVGGLAAFLGILEFVFSGFVYRDLMLLPGLTQNVDLASETRSGFNRITAGASHPIEFSVVSASLVPLAVHFCLHAATSRWRYALALVALLVALPMSVSRSGILTLAVGLAVYTVALTHRGRFNALVLGVIGLGVFRALVPGLLGTVRSLFMDVGTDPSIAGRTDDYASIPFLLDGSWWLGRGPGTFLPDVYFFLDNQYLAALIQGGVVGLTAFVVLLVVGMGVARGVRRRTADPALRSEGQALAATIASFAAAALVFDSLSFRQSAFVLFLVIGCAGAHWSLVRDQPKIYRQRAADTEPAATPQPRSPKWAIGPLAERLRVVLAHDGAVSTGVAGWRGRGWRWRSRAS